MKGEVAILRLFSLYNILMKKITHDIFLKEFTNNGQLAVCLFWTEGCELCKKAKKSLEQVKAGADKFKFFQYEIVETADMRLIGRLGIKDFPALLLTDGKGNLLGVATRKLSVLEIEDFLTGAVIVHSPPSKMPPLLVKIKTLFIDIALTLRRLLTRQKMFVSTDQLLHRAMRCGVCPERVTKEKIGEVCNACGCKLSLKMWLAAAECKKGFWNDSLLKK